MVEQKTVDLNKPLDAAENPVISRVPLEPSLATVALTLHGDIYRQAQSKTNHAIVWHPLVQGYAFIVFLIATIYVFKDLVEILDSVIEFFDLLKHNKYVLTRYFPAMIFVAGTIGLISFTITDEFRVISDKMTTEKYMAQVFRFPLKIYASALSNEQNSAFVKSASQSTDLIEYRNSPIAIVTVVPLPNQSSKDTFVAKITGLHVRKAYSSAGVETDLLNYAIEKARILCNRYVTDNKIHTKNIRITLIAEAYSVDKTLNSLYQQHGFLIREKSTKLDPFSSQATKSFFYVIPAASMLKCFGITRVTYERELDNVVDLESGTTSTNKKNSKVRKRA